MPIHGNGNHLVHLLFDIAGDSLTFVADDEGQLACCIPLMRRRPLHIRTENPKTSFLELVTRAMGICSMAPVEVLATTGVTPTARCLGMMIPATLVASAVRKIEPRLCGSVSPSKINKSGLSSCSAFFKSTSKSV